jgi:hypothetical protein
MVWLLDITAYKPIVEHKDFFEFKAIVPIYTDWGRGQGDTPINTVQITGYCVSTRYFDECQFEVWHPDNAFSDQKFIECYLHLCCFRGKGEKRHEIRSRQGWYGDENYPSYRYFVEAHQLQPLHRHTEKTYRSKEREIRDMGIESESDGDYKVNGYWASERFMGANA